MRSGIAASASCILVTLIPLYAGAADPRVVLEPDTNPMSAVSGFVANRGQIQGDARFYAKGLGGFVYFEPQSVVLDRLPRKDGEPGLVVRVTFPNRDRNIALQGTHPQETRVSSFLGNDPSGWRSDLPNFDEVRYEGISPGADLVYRIIDGKLKYDVVLAPGADLSSVRLRYEGVRSVKLDRSGALVLSTDAGDLREGMPLLYQLRRGTRVPVTGGYLLLSDREIGFWASGHERSLPLVVDPGLEWSTFLGGTSIDQAWHVKTDAAGNLYVVGSSTSTDYPTTVGVYQENKGASRDVVVTKVLGDGSGLIWSTFLGGNGSSEEARCLDVDRSGNVYVTGYTNSTDFPTTPGALKTTNPSATAEVFVTKLNAAGDGLVYSTYLGGGSDDYGYAIGVDGSGAVTVAGFSSSGDFPTTAGVIKPTFVPSFFDLADAFVAKLNAAGSSLVYSTYLGAAGSEGVYGLALDATGAPILVGRTSSLGYPVTPTAYDRTYDSGWEGFLTRLNGTGTAYVYSTFLGGNGQDEILGVALDVSGSVYVTGLTASTNFPTSSGGFQRSYGGGTSDAFVAKMSPAGDSLTWSSYLGGSGSDAGYAIVLLPECCVGVTGATNSTNFPVTGGAYDSSNNGGVDAFASTVSMDGASLSYSTYLGGSGFEAGRGITVNPNGRAVIAGYTDSGNFPTTAGAFDQSKNGSANYDCFLTAVDTGVSPSPVDVYDGLPGLSLSSPIPNPFLSNTTVHLTVGRVTRAVVRVLDARGRLIRKLADHDLAPGDYSWTWDGRDLEGRDVGAGVYLLELLTPDGRKGRRVIRLE